MVSNLYEYAVQLNFVTGKFVFPASILLSLECPVVIQYPVSTNWREQVWRYTIPWVPFSHRLCTMSLPSCSNTTFHLLFFTRNIFEQFSLLPPILKYTVASRKRKKRFKSRKEEGASLWRLCGKYYMCSLCGKVDGHNRSRAVTWTWKRTLTLLTLKVYVLYIGHKKRVLIGPFWLAETEITSSLAISNLLSPIYRT